MSAGVHRLFAARAREAPDRTAVVDGAVVWSYGLLDAQANRLAHFLLRRGVGPEARVGLLLPRSATLIGGMLAVLKAGACYVPLDPDHPPERLRFLARTARLDLLLTGEELLASLGDPRPAVVCVDSEQSAIDRQSTWEPESARSDAPDRLAYLVFTSGSTGTPKAVMVPHRGLANLCRWHLRAFGVGPHDRASQLASVAFDASAYETWPYLVSGASLVLVPPEVRSSALELSRWQAERRVTVGYVPTVVVEELLGGAWSEAAAVPSSLRVVFTGGDLLRRGPARPLPCALENGYGPAEATVVSTSGRVEPGAPGPPTIGRAIEGAVVRLLDPAMEPVPTGEAGEVHVGGAGLARGYANRPGRTAGAFVPDPFGLPGARLYRTGDRARRRPGGDLEFLGRLDDQVKIRGHRVEPGEIETALARHPRVGSAVVVPQGRGPGRRLIAFVTARGGRAPEPGELRGWAGRRLPAFMVPARFVALEELPRTPHGKIDRAALLEAAAAPDPMAAGRSPHTPLEHVLAGIWAEALDTGAVGVDDSFLELGGHSLTAARVLAAIRRELGVPLTPADLYEASTVAELARRLGSASGPGAGQVPRLPPRPAGPVPASYPQEAIWFLHRIKRRQSAYNSQAILRFRGRLDPAALRHALRRIVERHEILRTTFHALDDALVQVVHPRGVVVLTQSDLCALEPDVRERALADLVEAELRGTVDVGRLPLARWHLVHLAADDSLLIHAEHHFLHDGWSFGNFLHELKELYEARLERRPPVLPELEMQYADYALWQREWLRGPEAEAQIRYWRETLGEPPPPPLELPRDRPRPETFSFRGSAVRVLLQPGTVEAARRLSREADATLYTTCFAVFEALLARYTGRSDFCVGASMANRQRLEHLPLIGLVVNMVPVRADVEGGPPLRELVRRVRATLLQAQAHQEVPFDRIVEATQPDRTLRHNPLFQVGFNFHHAPMPAFSLGGVEFVPEEAHNVGAVKFDLQVIAFPRREQHSGRGADEIPVLWEYSTDLFDRATVDRMHRHYDVLLAEACRHPDRALSSLPVLTREERHCTLFEWSAGPGADRVSEGVHRLFEETAARMPDRLAVTLGHQALTFGELDRRASTVARLLRSRGVAAESRVGLLFERSLEMAVAVLAVIEAGATCLPLDPAYPEERLAWMVEDASVDVILTSGEAPPALARRRTVVQLESAPAPRGRDRRKRAPEVDADHPAYVIYTSGSTGRPKGVVLPHRALVNVVHWATADPAPFRRHLQFASLSFDVSFLELLATWAAGGTVCLVPEEARREVTRLVRLIDEQCVTGAILPVTVLDHLAREVLDRGDGSLGSLRTLVSTGEQLKVTTALRRLLTVRPGLQLKNYYGPSETHVTTARDLDGPPDSWPAAPSIGRPIQGTVSYALDPDLEPAPIGVPAHLHLGGESLARGYLGRPGLTAERFVPAPLGLGERLYRTGDQCRWLPSGDLEFLGRLDDQVKIRGLRVEPGEIESVLMTQPTVAQAAVALRQLPNGELGLVAYVVRAGGDGEPCGDALRRFLRDRVPEAMVPAAFVELEAIPLGFTGKVDRNALPEPKLAPSAAEVPDRPRRPVEEVVAMVWSHVLGRRDIGVRKSFFDLGGHSLLALRVTSNLGRIFQLDLPAQALFEDRTVESLSQRLERSLPDPGLAEQIALTFLEVQALSDEDLRERG